MKYSPFGVLSSRFWEEYFEGVPKEEDAPKKEVFLACKDARADYRKEFGERPIPIVMA
ncbi:MAG: hypothetical protein HYR95_02495 [Candidatus Colwellbacteria bacterium]|nr:hypothetical protein [Candidatus Colwellbacteria bacterium]